MYNAILYQILASFKFSLILASGNPLVTSEIIRNWEPFFVEQVPNITVAAGKDATLHCQVDNLHGYKVINFR